MSPMTSGLSLAAVCLTDRDFDSWARTAWPALCDAIVAEHGGSPDQE